jgi:ABC-2 type transport system permease protein
VAGLLKLTWVEIKIFLREPLGVLGAVGVPLLVFIVMGRLVGRAGGSADAGRFVQVGLPVFASVLITLNAVASLVTIVSIYREGGILKRLRATPLKPHTILTAHVLVKLLLTVATWALMIAAGARYYPVDLNAPLFGFSIALLISTLSILSMGFVIASLVPTARFAQPLASLVLYPMIAVSGLFAPVDSLSPPLQTVARALPLTYAVSLLKGIWQGHPWSAHLLDVAALIVTFGVFAAISSRLFRWE